jgi:hypothetical protein
MLGVSGDIIISRRHRKTNTLLTIIDAIKQKKVKQKSFKFELQKSFFYHNCFHSYDNVHHVYITNTTYAITI